MNQMKSLTVNQIVDHYNAHKQIYLFFKKDEIRSNRTSQGSLFHQVFPLVVKADGTVDEHINYRLNIKPKWKRVIDINKSDYWCLVIDASQKVKFDSGDEEVEFYQTNLKFVKSDKIIDNILKTYTTIHNVEELEEFDEVL